MVGGKCPTIPSGVEVIPESSTGIISTSPFQVTLQRLISKSAEEIHGQGHHVHVNGLPVNIRKTAKKSQKHEKSPIARAHRIRPEKVQLKVSRKVLSFKETFSVCIYVQKKCSEEVFRIIIKFKFRSKIDTKFWSNSRNSQLFFEIFIFS